jgi:outer membrane biosynthesis protein TonB
MVGWCFLLMLVIIVLGWRERKKNTRKFSEINTRLAQVEELLLEVCALVEENVIQEDLSPLPNELGEPVELEEPIITPEPVVPEKLEKPEMVEKRESSNRKGKTDKPPQSAAVQKEKAVSTREQLEQPEQAGPPASPPKMPAKQGSKQTKGKKVKTAKGQKLSPLNQQIIELWQKGLSVQEIARQIEKGQGEVQLIIDLYCDERPQS